MHYPFLCIFGIIDIYNNEGEPSMISFKNDYNEIAHPKVLEKLLTAQEKQFNGYGLDIHSTIAKEAIQKHINKDVDIHFLVGGTNANKTIINHILRPYEAVISTDIGHIEVHETGAIEAGGNKIILVPAIDGKLTPEQIEHVVALHQDEHMVIPKMVYISNSTEIGSIYSLEELTALYNITRRLDLFLFIDGARLGAAISASNNTINLNHIANLSDVFYIGGTKNGAMFGEAVVLVHPNIKHNFRHSIKRNGGLLAKGFVTALQFEALFENDCYFSCANHAVQTAKILVDKLETLPVEFFYKSPTNQQFIWLPNSICLALSKEFAFETWVKEKDRSVIRLVTSWATKIENIDIFINTLTKHLEKK